MQLISRDRPEGQAELSVVQNPYERKPDSFETQTEHPLLIGSQEVILLAAGLCNQGFRAVELALTDRYFVRLGDEESQELAEQLVKLVNDSQVADLDRFMRSELPGTYVESIRLLDPSMRGSVLLRQEGIVITSPNVAPEDLSRSVQTAARWAHAS